MGGMNGTSRRKNGPLDARPRAANTDADEPLYDATNRGRRVSILHRPYRDLLGDGFGHSLELSADLSDPQPELVRVKVLRGPAKSPTRSGQVPVEWQSGTQAGYVCERFAPLWQRPSPALADATSSWRSADCRRIVEGLSKRCRRIVEALSKDCRTSLEQLSKPCRTIAEQPGRVLP